MNNLYKYDRAFRIILSLSLFYISDIGYNPYIILALLLLATASIGYCYFKWKNRFSK